MPRPRWEDFSSGQITDCGSRVVARVDMVAFAAEFGPRPIHLDELAARAPALGDLVASGRHSCCILVRMAS